MAYSDLMLHRHSEEDDQQMLLIHHICHIKERNDHIKIVQYNNEKNFQIEQYEKKWTC